MHANQTSHNFSTDLHFIKQFLTEINHNFMQSNKIRPFELANINAINIDNFNNKCSNLLKIGKFELNYTSY